MGGNYYVDLPLLLLAETDTDKKGYRPMALVRAMSKAKVPKGKICEVGLNRKSLAVANVEGKPCIISNICTHEQGPLGHGVLEGTVVTCPWHDWKFDVTSGKLLNAEGEGAKTFAAVVQGEDILVDLD